MPKAHSDDIIPVKIQVDVTGFNILIYDETKTSLFVQVEDPVEVMEFRDLLNLGPLEKTYRRAFITPEGTLMIDAENELTELNW